MKKNILAAAVMAATTLLFVGCGEDKANAAQVQDTATAAATSGAAGKVSAQSSFDDKVSYSIGASVGTYVATIQREQKEFIGDVNKDLVVQGFIDALNESTALNEQEIADTLMALDKKVREGLEKKQAEAAQKTLAEGQKFLEENAKKEGVKTTASGLQYKIITEGKGKTPTTSDMVKVRYKGTTIDGTVFDEQKDPISLPLANIIPGWIEGLQLMKEGGKAQLFIPSDLAYGEMDAGDVIKPNSVLIFDIELVEVVPGDTDDKAKK